MTLYCIQQVSIGQEGGNQVTLPKKNRHNIVILCMTVHVLHLVCILYDK